MQKTRAIRITKKATLGLVVTVGLYASIGFLVLPYAARHAINTALKDYVQVPSRVERIEFNPFTGELAVHDLRIGEGDQRLLAFSRLYLDLQIDSLWTRALHLRGVVLDNADVELQRTQDGGLTLVSAMALPATGSEPATSEPGNRLFPVRIDAITLNNGKLNWLDAQPAAPVKVQVHPLTLTVSGLSTLPDEKSTLTLHADAGKAGRLDAFMDVAVAARHVTGSLRLEDVNLSRFWPYVQAQVPLALQRGKLSVSADIDVAAADMLSARINNGSVALRSVSVKDRHDTSMLMLAALDAKGIQADLQKKRTHIGNVQVEGLDVPLVREADGRLHWQRILAGASTPAAPAGKAAESERQWRVDIPSISLKNVNVPVTDQSVVPATTVDIKALQLSLHDFDNANVKPLRLSMSADVGVQGKVSGEGELTLAPVSAQMNITTQAIDLRLAQAYLNPHVRLELRSGLLDSQLQLQLTSADPLALSVGGDLRIHQLHAVDTLQNQDLLKWQQLALSGVQYQHGQRLQIDKVSLKAPYARFVINENRSTNVGELAIKATAGEVAAPPKDAAAAPLAASDSKALPIRIGGIDIDDGSAYFADYSLVPNFSTAIAQLNGKIGTLDNQQATPALLDIQGKVDRYAPVSIVGGLTPFDPLQALDINARFKRIELTTLTPYSGKFAGYRIRKGRLNLDLHYQIHQGQLNAQNKVVLEELQLGEKVESPDAVDLPVRLAVALLKDAKGNIKVELPIEGDLNNPKFDIGPVIWKTFRNLIVRAVKSPFTFIGGLIKGDSSENLDSIAFAPGSSELSQVAIGKLQTVAAALKERPELRLEIEGASARQPDGEPMAQQLLQVELRKAYARQQQGRGIKLPADIATLNVPDDQTLVLLEKIHVDLVKKPLPAGWKDLSAKDRRAHLQAAILDVLGESGRRLRQLAGERAAAIKGWLVDEGGLADARIYLLNAQVHDDKPAEAVMTTLYLDSE